jgi:hypothetical protein
MLYRQPEWRRRTIKKQQKFSLQANRKIREGDSHPDRDAQFASINVAVGAPSRRPSGDLSQHQEKGRHQVECIEFHGEWNYTIPPKIRHFIFRQQTYPASHIYSQ